MSAAARPGVLSPPPSLTADRGQNRIWTGGLVTAFVCLACLAMSREAAAHRKRSLPSRPVASMPTEAASNGAASEGSRQTLLSAADLAFHGHRYAEAATFYHRAAEQDPQAGDLLVMAAVAEFQLGHYGSAGRDLDRASKRTLSPEDRELIGTYRALLADVTAAPAEAAVDEGFAATITSSIGGGYDSNPNRSGASQLDSEAAAGLRPGAAFGTGALELGLYGTPRPHLVLELGYTFEQSSQLNRTMADLDYQDHLLELRLRQTLSEGVRLDLALAGELSFTGTGTALTPFSNGARIDVDVVLGAGAVKLRLGGGFQATDVLDVQLGFLTGHRFEIRAVPIVEMAGWRATATARLRLEASGSARGEPVTDPTIDPAVPCETCNAVAVVPYSNRSASLAARLKAPPSWLLRPGFWVRLDARSYFEPARLESAAGGPTPRSTELGERTTATRAVGADLRLRITEAISLTARWDYSRFTGLFHPSSAAACEGHGECGQGALADRRYDKHNLGLELEVDWL